LKTCSVARRAESCISPFPVANVSGCASKSRDNWWNVVGKGGSSVMFKFKFKIPYKMTERKLTGARILCRPNLENTHSMHGGYVMGYPYFLTLQINQKHLISTLCVPQPETGRMQALVLARICTATIAVLCTALRFPKNNAKQQPSLLYPW
jgi:hypothetical protein